MKLLVDQNISWRVIRLIAHAFPDSVHVDEVGLGGAAPDIEIWKHAADNGFTILTKDADFNNLALLRTTPPQGGVAPTRQCLDQGDCRHRARTPERHRGVRGRRRRRGPRRHCTHVVLTTDRYRPSVVGTEAGLALEIARCPEIALARTAAGHPCAQIVRLQQDDARAFQVPEAWAGNLAAARVLFLSSNPSISEDGADHGASAAERYPRGDWSDADVADFMTQRFTPDAGYTIDDRFVCQDGTYARRPVRFWSQVRRRASELLGYPADPDRDYVMTEVVHCKSKGEVGVTSAAAVCAGRYLDRVVALSSAPLVVVVGSKARDRLRPILGLDDAFGSRSSVGDEHANVAVREVGGRRRVICYLWHPTGMTKWPRDFARSYPTLLLTLRAVALNELAVDAAL